MIRIDTVDLRQRKIRFPNNRVGMVLAQPYLPSTYLTGTEPYRFTGSRPPCRRAVRRTSERHEGDPGLGEGVADGHDLTQRPPEPRELVRSRVLEDGEALAAHVPCCGVETRR